MIEYTDKTGRLKFRVIVSPRASQTEIIGEHNGALRVRIAAPPVEGAANDELIRILARTFDRARSDVEIVSGHSAKRKTVSIAGGSAVKLKSFASPDHSSV